MITSIIIVFTILFIIYRFFKLVSHNCRDASTTKKVIGTFLCTVYLPIYIGEFCLQLVIYLMTTVSGKRVYKSYPKLPSGRFLTVAGACEYSIFESDESMLLYGGACIGDFDQDGNIVKILMIDKEITGEVREAILAHETGHAVYRQTHKVSWWNPEEHFAGGRLSLQDEIGADNYAVRENLGRPLLKHILKHIASAPITVGVRCWNILRQL